jgi:hypothetical protein
MKRYKPHNDIEIFDHVYMLNCPLCERSVRKGIWVEELNYFHFECAEYLLKEFGNIFDNIKQEKLIKKITGI